MARRTTPRTDAEIKDIINSVLKEREAEGRKRKVVSVPFYDIRGTARRDALAAAALPTSRRNTGPLSMKEVKARYAPPITKGAPRDVQMAMDAALANGGVYSLLQHTFAGIKEVLYPQFLGYGVLSGLMQNQVIRSGVEMMADEMTRKWIKISRLGEVDTDDKDDEEDERSRIERDIDELDDEAKAGDADDKTIQDLEQACRKFDVRKLFRRAFSLTGYMGGCLVYIDTLGDDASEDALLSPLRFDSDVFRAGDLRGFKIIEPFNISPGDYQCTNPLRDDYFRPRTWWVQGRKVHASRFLYFACNLPSTLLLPAYNFFGIPIAQLVLDSVSHFTRTREATARALEKYSLTVFKTNLADITDTNFREEVMKRIQFLADWRDNDGVEVIDIENEDIQTVVSPIAGMTDIVRQSMDIVAAMFNEPGVKLWGITPAGMNATGEADLTNHYDNIAALQESIFSAPLKKMFDVLQWNLYEEIDDSITFTFEPLGVMNETSLAQVRTANANVDSTYINNGVLSAEEVRARLANDPNGGYPNIDISKLPPSRNINIAGGNPAGKSMQDNGGMKNVGEGNDPSARTALGGLNRRIQ